MTEDYRIQATDTKSKKGVERVDKILKATAELIAREGIGTLTVTRIAKESGTSMSSFYHFFPGVSSVVALLHKKHVSNVEGIVSRVNKNYDAKTWNKKSIAQFVCDLFTPIATYLVNNKDYLIELADRDDVYSTSVFFPFIEKVLKAKFIYLSDDEVSKESNILYALAIGLLMQLYKQKRDVAYNYIPDILKVITVYLINLDSNSPH